MKRITGLFILYSRNVLRAFLIALLIMLLIGVIGGTMMHLGYHDQARPIVSWCPGCSN